MVAVVLLTTLLTPLALRAAFHLKSQQDIEEGVEDPEAKVTSIGNPAPFASGHGATRERWSARPIQLRIMTPPATGLLAFEANDAASDLKS